MRKLLILFFLASCMQTLAQGQRRGIDITVQNERLENVFGLVERQSAYRFIYTTEDLVQAKRVSLSVKNAGIDSLLETVFKGQPVGYQLRGDVIVVAASKRDAVATNPPINVNGKVTDADGKPLADVNISLNQRKAITATDNNGNFTLNTVDADAVLYFSCIGFQGQVLSLHGRTSLIVQLLHSVNTLDETIIKGYYTTTKRLNTGSVTKVQGEEISKQIVTNPLQGLQGKSAGVFITTGSGLPGADVTVRIRGQNSIAAGNDPLYIIDGVPFSASPLNFSDDLNGANGKISPLNSINPSDIESVEILKDADATAIYGSRGANGVVLITTKKGIAGKTALKASVQTGYSALHRGIQYLNTAQYLALRKEAFKNDGIGPDNTNAPDLVSWNPNNYTDWRKFLAGETAHTTEAQVSISGGNQYTRFLIGGNFHRETSIYPGDTYYQRSGYHLNLQHNSTSNKFGIEATIGITSDINRLLVADGMSASTLPPNYPLHNSDGALNWSGGANPLAVLNQKSKSQTNNFIGNAVARLQIIPHIQLKTMIGYTSTYLDQLLNYPLASLNPSFNSFNYSTFGHNQINSYIVEPQLQFDNSIATGKFKAILGLTSQQTKKTGSAIQGTNYSNESLMESLSAAGSIGTLSDFSSDYKYVSLFALVNYVYHDKYLLNASFRRDGSSRFGPGKEFGNFGAVGAAWIFSKENFFSGKLPFISYGKIRASYGITGNDQITDYQFLATYASQGLYQNIAALRPIRIANPLYSWESNHKSEIGLEMGFARDRFLLTANWYTNKSGNQLVSYPLATQSGFAYYQANLPAVLLNKGWEFELQSNNIKSSNFNWSTSFNISFQKNILKSYPGLEASSYANTLVIGKDVSVVKGYHFTGVDPQNGIAQYEDLNKDGQITNPADYTVLGKTSPDFFGGIGNTISYKGISLDFFFRFTKQKGYTYPVYGSGLFNAPIEVLARWQKPGDITSVPQLSATPGTAAYNANINLGQSDGVFVDASFIRLQSAQLSYQLPTKLLSRIKASGATLYMKGQNLFILSSYKHWDPETQRNGIPLLTSFVMGLQFSF